MGKKLHPALEWERDQIARAAYFTAVQYTGRGYDRREAQTLADAIAIAKTMPDAMGGVMIYAVTADRHDPYVTTIWPGAGTIKPRKENDMSDIATTNDNGTSKEPKARRAKGKGRAKGKPAARPAKATPSTEPKTLAQGKTYWLKRTVLQNPSISTDDLDAELIRRGFASSKSMAASFKGDLLHTPRLLAELGMLDWPRKT